MKFKNNATTPEKLKAIHNEIIRYCFNHDCSEPPNDCDYKPCLTFQFNSLYDTLTPEQQENLLIELHCSETNC